MHIQNSGQFATGEPIDLLDLGGRILAQGIETTCTVRWVHDRTARVALVRPVTLSADDRVVVYMDLLGRIEGAATQVGLAELDVDIAAPDAKWARLQRQIATVAAMAPADRENLRGHRRIAPDRVDVRLTSADGIETAAQVRDVSRSGAAVSSGTRPEVGTLVTLGNTRARVVRMLDGGFAVQFLRLLPLESFGAAYVL